jgi:hypothetical protein
MQNNHFEMALSMMAAWECGSCTYTNKGSEPGPCVMCRTECLIHYAIVAGAPAAATARRTTVNPCKQAHVAASATSAAAAAAVTAVDATAPAADAGEATAIARPLMPVAVLNCGTQKRDTVIARLVSTLIDIAGTGTSRGRSCNRHETCGMQVEVGTKVMFRWEKVVYRDQEEEDAVAVFLVANGTMMCKVGFVPAHIARHAQDYDGLIVRVISVYSDRCMNVVKRQKFWRNKGCCVARILGSCPIFSL